MGKIRAAVTAVLMLFCMAYGNASELEREWDGVIYPRPQKILSEVEKIELIHGHFAMQIDPEARTSATIVTANYFANSIKEKFATFSYPPDASGKRVVMRYGLISNNQTYNDLNGDVPMLPEQGYVIRTVENTPEQLIFVVAGVDPRGLWNGINTVLQMISVEDGKFILNYVEVEDYPYWPERFVSEANKLVDEQDLLDIAAMKVGNFALQYRKDWKSFTDSPEIIASLSAMQKMSSLDLMRFMLLLHIYVTPNNEPHFNIASEEDVQGLIDRCRMAAEYGIETIMICVDDYTPRVGNEYTFFNEDEARAFDNSIGKAHGYLMRRIYEALIPDFPSLRLAMVGAPYSVNRHEIHLDSIAKYIKDWGQEAPLDVFWVWTGPEVCSPKISKEDYLAFQELLNGQDLFVWDNSNMFSYPMPRWETEFYPEMADDSYGIIYMNGGIVSRWWCRPYFMTANDYLWNPEGYNPESSYREALRKLYGVDAVAPAEELRKCMIACQNAFEAGDRQELTAKLPEFQAAYNKVKSIKTRSGEDMDMTTLDQVMNKMVTFSSVQVPTLKVPKTTANVAVDGEINSEEWQNAAEFTLVANDEEATPVKGKAMYDDRGVYFAFEVFNDAELPPLGEQPHDSSVYLNDDHLEVFLQPSAMGKYGHWCFDYEGNRFDEPGNEGGFMWNPDWQLKVKRLNNGWQAEMFIPVAELEILTPKAPATGVMWRANFFRFDAPQKKVFSWSRGGDRFHDTQFFGDLIFE